MKIKAQLKKTVPWILSAFMLLAFIPSMTPAASAADESASYPDGTVIISLVDGIPTSENGNGWTYDSASNTLTLTNGNSYAVDGVCQAIVNNTGTIVGGTYSNTVNNIGDNDTTSKEEFAVIDGGVFNGEVINGDGWDICTIKNGTFNGGVTNKNKGVVSGGVFNGEFSKLIGSTVSGGTFIVEFVVNGGTWAIGYAVPTTYTYESGLALPTSETISNGTLAFDGWYDNAEFSGLPKSEIPAGSYGKLKFYARFIDGIATWEIAGNQAVENTDYTASADGNYTVLTAKGLAKIANIVNGGDSLSGRTVTLANNIDLSGGGVYRYGKDTVTERNSWIPISGFAGTFDGNGKKIDNLYVLTTNADAGLFGSNAGTIKDLEVASGKVTINVSSGSELHAGAVAATTSGLVDNCVNRAEVYSNDTSGSGSVYIGGITGLVSTSTVGATVSTVSNCTNYGTISSLGSSSCGISGGGIAGYQFSGYITGRKTLITRCINNGIISIEPGMGGWAGGIAGTVKSNSNSNTSITATVINCANNASVGSNMAGGITGYNTYAAYVYNCYNTGSITGNTNAGGIVGLNYYSNATVANCYSTGSVYEATNIGGIVGRIPSGSISNCYYLSSAASEAYGYKATSATVTDCAAFTTSDSTHTLASAVYETTDLLTALKAWVTAKNSAEYMSWAADTSNSNYPVLIEEEESFARLAEYSISLKGNIAINFYMSMSADVAADESAYMQFTMADGEVVTIPMGDAELVGGFYKFTASVAVKEMTDDVKAQFFYNNGAASTEEYAYSVKEYADHLLENTGSVAEYAAAADLVEAMLHNGAYAQIHFGYNTSALANDGLEKADLSGVTAETLKDFASTGEQGTDKAKLTATGILLKSETTLRLFFEVQDGASLSVMHNSQALEVNCRDGMYYVDIKNISAKDLDENITVEVNDGTASADVTVNPMTYCYNVLSDTGGEYTEDLLNVVKALYLYNQAANEYFND